MLTDPISDMLTRIRNAQMAKKSEALVPYSKLKWEIARLLKEGDWILNFEKVKNNHEEIKISLKYEDGKPAITSLQRVSKPGNRVYAGKDKLPRVLNGLGEAFLSTSQGLMTNKKARKVGVGGEIICEVY